MKTGIICPIPDLTRFVTPDLTYHLILAHLFEHPEWGENYRSFYKHRAMNGDFITLDNGAKELGEGLPMGQLLDLAEDIRASEVVVPDVRFECIRTLQSGSEALFWIRNGGRERYEDAGKPQLMVVPQGKTFGEWSFCCQQLYGHARATMHVLGGPDPTIGVAYHYDHVFESTPFRHLIYSAINRAGIENVHLLGWTRRLQTMGESVDAYPGLRSVDSSRPLVYAKSGLLCGAGEYPDRGEDFFFEHLPSETWGVAHQNIVMFRELANDGLY